MPRLSSKVAFITGGGTGIGRACALLFAREGAQLVVTGRRDEPLRSVVREIESAGGQALAIRCDVTQRDSVEAALSGSAEYFGRVNVIVNNAGAVVVADADHTSEAEWRQVIDVNLTGTFLVSRTALPLLRKQGGGSIVNIGSALGLVARKQRAAYCAAKFGITGLTKAMAIDHAHEKIRVNCICPTIVETELGMQSIAVLPDPEAERRKRSAEIPLGRMGRPEDVAQMAVYLASDESEWVTGAAFPLDGGLTAY
ncbi:MAG TPA: SDR family oxidoreductase [Candidatus Cybelea sp.]|nr:SDR family oxidoreductase [Candidatus Cybelea sp.]